MGIFDAPQSTTTLTQQSNWTPEQKALFAQLMQQTQTGLAQGSTAYPGVTSAPQNPLESAYFQSAQLSPEGTTSRENALRSILAGTPAYTVDPAQSQQYYQSAFYDPAMREYQQTILPQVMEGASGAGFHSSDTLYQMGKSATDLETNLAAKRAELVYQDIMAGRTAQESAASRQAALAGSPTNVMTGYTQQLGTAGQYARQIENEKIQGDLARWLSGEKVGGVSNQAYNPNVQLALTLLGLAPYSYGSNVDASGAGVGYGFLQGAAGGAGNATANALINALLNSGKG